MLQFRSWGSACQDPLGQLLVDTELSLLLAWVPGLEAGYTVSLQFILHCPEASSGALKERRVQAISLGQDLLGLYRTVGSPVCDRLGTRAWQGMAGYGSHHNSFQTSPHKPASPQHPLSSPFLMTQGPAVSRKLPTPVWDLLMSPDGATSREQLPTSGPHPRGPGNLS